MRIILGMWDSNMSILMVCFGLVTITEIHANILTVNQISGGPDPETPGNSSVLHRPQ